MCLESNPTDIPAIHLPSKVCLGGSKGCGGGELRARLSYSTSWSSPFLHFMGCSAQLFGKSPLKNTTVLNSLTLSFSLIHSISRNTAQKGDPWGWGWWQNTEPVLQTTAKGKGFAAGFRCLCSEQSPSSAASLSRDLCAPHPEPCWGWHLISDWLKTKHKETGFHTLDPLPLALSLHAFTKSHSMSRSLPSGTGRCPKVSLEQSLFQAEQSNSLSFSL